MKRRGGSSQSQRDCFGYLQVSSIEFKMKTSVRTTDKKPFIAGLFRVLLIVTWVVSAGSHQPGARSSDEFTIQQLLTKRFPHRISDDIYLDPCKAGKKVLLFLHLKTKSIRAYQESLNRSCHFEHFLYQQAL